MWFKKALIRGLINLQAIILSGGLLFVGPTQAEQADLRKRNGTTLLHQVSPFRDKGRNQEGSALPRPLHLREAIRWALTHNLAIRVAKAQVEERFGETLHAARPVPSNPTLRTQFGFRDKPGDNSNDIQIRLSQELWIAGQGGLQQADAEARLQGAQSKLEFLRTSVAARTRQAFLNLLVAREAVSTAERVHELAQKVQNYAERRLKAGEATRFEVNTAAIGVGRALDALAIARRDRAQAQLALAETLSIDPTATFEVKGKVVANKLEIPNNNRLLILSLQRRQDLAAAAQDVLATREELQLNQRLLIPNLTVFGFYQEEEGTDTIPGFGFSFPLPVLHRFQGERKSAAARLRQAQLQQDTLTLAVRREVLSALADYQSARERVSVLTERMLRNAEENLRLTQTAVQAGQVAAPALTTAQDNLFNVRQAYLAALRDLTAAGSSLERATGGIITMTQSSAAESLDE